MLVKDIDKELANKASVVLVKEEVWNGHTIRFIYRMGKYWAVAQDVAVALGIENMSVALKDMPYIYIGNAYIGVETGIKRDGTPAKRKVKVLTLTELGVYWLIMRSDKLEAKHFQDYVFQMIKSLRETLGLKDYQAFGLMDKEDKKRRCKIA